MSLQYKHIRLLSRDPSTPADGLGGLGVPINLLPLLVLLDGVFLLPTYRQDIACDIVVTNCCGLTPVACMAFKFSNFKFKSPTFVSQ